MSFLGKSVVEVFDQVIAEVQPDGRVAIKKPNGKYISFDPDGNEKEADKVGSWEAALPTSKGLLYDGSLDGFHGKAYLKAFFQ